MPAPANSERGAAGMDQRKTGHLSRQSIIRSRTAFFMVKLHIGPKASASISVARPMHPSTRRPPCRHLCAVGRDPTRRSAASLPRASTMRRSGRAGRRRASASRCGRSLPRPKSRPGRRPRRFWRVPPRFRTRLATASRPTATPPPVRAACSRLPIRAAASTSGSGPRSQSSPAPTATLQHWSARPEQVAEVFGDYYDLGISHFLIRGFDPLIDPIDYGRELIPLTRELVAKRQAIRGEAAE